MSLRLLEAYLPRVEGERLKEILKERALVSFWYEKLPEGVTQAKLVLAERRVKVSSASSTRISDPWKGYASCSCRWRQTCPA